MLLDFGVEFIECGDQARVVSLEDVFEYLIIVVVIQIHFVLRVLAVGVIPENLKIVLNSILAQHVLLW